jgi:hypothetical protein
MIVFDLICSDGHRFESWFRNGAAYDDQSKHNAIICPVCGDTTVEKAPVRLFVGRRGGQPAADKAERHAAPAEGRASAPSAAASASAPPQAGASEAAPPPAQPVPVAAEETFRKMRKLVEATCDDVGREFPEQARRIHYGETAPRAIYGEASADEAKALREEGIEVQPLPWMRRRHD